MSSASYPSAFVHTLLDTIDGLEERLAQLTQELAALRQNPVAPVEPPPVPDVPLCPVSSSPLVNYDRWERCEFVYRSKRFVAYWHGPQDARCYHLHTPGSGQFENDRRTLAALYW
jgi:hypothetical protein